VTSSLSVPPCLRGAPSSPRDGLWALGLAAFCLALYLHDLGGVGLVDADEPAYAEAARQMVETGDWVTPRFNGRNRYDKPILFYWLIAAAYGLFGVSPFALRFTSAAAASALVVLTFAFLRRFRGPRAGLLGGLVLATSLAVLAWARAGVTDMLLTLFLAGGLYAFFLAYAAPQPGGRAWFWGLYAGMALATVTKGLVGVVFPVLILGAFLALARRLRPTLGAMRLGPGLALFAALALPWYLLQLGLNGWEFVEAFFLKHHVGRYTGVVSSHAGPLFYYIPVTLAGFFPWSAYVPRALWEARAPSLAAARRAPPGEQLRLFAAVWFLAIFLFFSFAGTKLPSYLLPAFPALAILVAEAWDGIVGRHGTGGLLHASHLGLAGLALCLAAAWVAVPVLLPRLEARLVPFLSGPLELGAAPALLAAACLAVAGGALLARRRRRAAGFAVIVAGMVAFSIVAVRGLLPAVDAAWQRPLRELAVAARAAAGREGSVAFYGGNFPSVVFYAGSPVVQVGRGQLDRLAALARSPGPVAVMTRAALAAEATAGTGLRLGERRGAFALLVKEME
jgi:4-amino-4-deoxy-L-arabinose transferase-like glycosyltransferase